VQVKSTRIYLHDTTLVTPYPLLLFGGNVKINHAKRRATVNGLGSHEFVIAPRTAVVFKELRRHIDRYTCTISRVWAEVRPIPDT
jgi:hypothetical protein